MLLIINAHAEALMYKGFLISIEGIDGSGKSTLARNLAQLLIEKNYDILLTKQPGGTPLGLRLREILHSQKESVCDKTEFLLFAADRAQHFATVVLPALEQGKIVISDRMHDSSLAYQGFGRSLDHNLITTVNRWAMNNRMPNLTIYVKIDAATAFARLNTSRTELTRIEQEQFDFWERVIHGFQTIFSHQDNVVTLDGTKAPEVLAQTGIEIITTKLRLNLQ